MIYRHFSTHLISVMTKQLFGIVRLYRFHGWMTQRGPFVILFCIFIQPLKKLFKRRVTYCVVLCCASCIVNKLR